MNLYLNCFLISLIGLALSIVTAIYSLTTKARLANVIFDWKLYFKTDLWAQLTGTLLSVGLFLMLLGPFLKQFTDLAGQTFYIEAFFSGVGYLGSDVASRFFSVVSKRINGAIDVKTTQADTANGTLGAPTPAAKPK